MSITWIQAGRHAHQTVEILERGSYEVDGKTVDIAASLAAAVKGTVGYRPEQPVDWAPEERGETRIEVRNEPTLAAARRQVEAGLSPMVLNFASAIHPGGKFLGGALAQEEYLARSSGLYFCIRGHDFYAHHKGQDDPMYSAYAIYSPGVPVIRDDDGDALLSAPYEATMITCAAVLAKEVLNRDYGRRPEVRAAMAERIDRVLRIAGLHGHDALVLGAWGCGAFDNDPKVIAELFKEALEGPFKGAFREVAFAIYDTSRTKRFIRPFEEALLPH